MIRRVGPPCSLHSGLTACSAFMHLALWHKHRYRVVTSSCPSHRGHASRRGCHIPRCSGTSTMPVDGDSRRSSSIRGWRACGGLHLLGAGMGHSMSAEPCAVGRPPYVADSGRGTAGRCPLALLSTAFVACASARMLPIFRTSLWLVSADTSWWDFTHQCVAAASPTDRCSALRRGCFYCSGGFSANAAAACASYVCSIVCAPRSRRRSTTNRPSTTPSSLAVVLSTHVSRGTANPTTCR